ncbi:DNA mismatch repair protein [Rhizophlyctis rosea]|nr:DNA mismatch repair protein [Rhizophlyctis rosea]
MMKPKTPGAGRAPEHKLVRTDSRMRTLDAFISPSQQSQQPQQPVGFGSSAHVVESTMDTRKRPREENVSFDELVEETSPAPKRDKGKRRATDEDDERRAAVAMEADGEETQMSDSPDGDRAKRKRDFVDVRLSSVLELRQEVQDSSHAALTSLFKDHTFVGCVDDEIALVQHQTRLYLVNHKELSKELFYQLALKGFSNFGFIHLSQPAPIYDLVMVALEPEDLGEYGENMMSKEEIAERIVATLIDRSEMLLEYFCMTITPEGEMQSLPQMLRGYLPNWNKLPLFLLRLGTEVNWEEEKGCFETFSRELAEFYAVEPPDILDDEPLEPDVGEETDTPNVEKESKEKTEYRRMIEHIIFPAFKAHLQTPAKVATDGTVLQLANLPDLYRVFERC